MRMPLTFCAKNRQEWRGWLEKNYAGEKEVWLVYYKAGSGKETIPYEDSVEEALCFGWIDSLIQKIDAEKYARKFTPRTNTAKWSDTNRRRLGKVIREGRMTEAGMAKISDPEKILEVLPTSKEKFEIPMDIEQAIQANPKAWETYNALSPSSRKKYLGWVLSAKKEETVGRRLKEVIELLEQNKPLGMK